MIPAVASGERGTSLVELLVATSLGLSLAGLLGHTLTTYQIHYHHAVTRISADQQSRFALTLMAEEIAVRLRSSAAASCPPAGVRVADGRVEFGANLYDRSTALRDDALAGQSELRVAATGAFEAGDLIMLVDVQDPTDPGDDIADCVRMTAVSANQWAIERALTHAFPAGSQITLVNRVTYTLDQLGRLMRTQDGGTQRIAQNVTVFDARVEDAALVIRLSVNEGPEWSQRIRLEDEG